MNCNVELHINPVNGTWTLGATEQGQVVLVFDDTCSTESRELVFHLVGEGAVLDVIFIAQRTVPELLKVSLRIVHEGARTKAAVWAASVLQNSAAQDVRGMIQICKGAKGADSALSHRTLTLSATAKSVTIPSLEIEEDDVKASHAGVTGPVDPEQLFYLQTRGVSTEEAQQVIAQGFLEQVIEKIKDEGIRENVNKLLSLDVIPAKAGIQVNPH